MLETVAMWVGLIGGSIAIVGLLIRITRWLRGRFLDPRKVWAVPESLQKGHGMIAVVNDASAPIYRVYERVNWGGVEGKPDDSAPEQEPGARALSMVHFVSGQPDPDARADIWIWWTDAWGRRWQRGPDGQISRLE